MRSIFIVGVLLIERSKTQEVVFIQEIILLGRIRCYEPVFIIDATCVAQRAVPKWVYEGTSMELHFMAVGAT
jgi:hypothetical protein